MSITNYFVMELEINWTVSDAFKACVIEWVCLDSAFEFRNQKYEHILGKFEVLLWFKLLVACLYKIQGNFFSPIRKLLDCDLSN